MVKAGYAPGFAAALSSTSAIIGPIIPPSIPMVLYGVVSDTSIGFLFMAGVIPGLLLAAGQSGVVAVLARTRDFPVEPPPTLREAVRITLDFAPVAHPSRHPARRHLLAARSRPPRPPPSPPPARSCWPSSGTARSRSAPSTACSSNSAKATGMVALTIAGALVMNWIVAAEQIPAARRRLDRQPRHVAGSVHAHRHHPLPPARRLPRHPADAAHHRADADADGARPRHRPGAFRRRLGGQHDDRPRHPAHRRARVPDGGRHRHQGRRRSAASSGRSSSCWSRSSSSSSTSPPSPSGCPRPWATWSRATSCAEQELPHARHERPRERNRPLPPLHRRRVGRLHAQGVARGGEPGDRRDHRLGAEGQPRGRRPRGAGGLEGAAGLGGAAAAVARHAAAHAGAAHPGEPRAAGGGGDGRAGQAHPRGARRDRGHGAAISSTPPRRRGGSPATSSPPTIPTSRSGSRRSRTASSWR